MREDYSDGGDAWNYFTHDQARSRAYHWGEDGLAGISDDRQQLCFALALWNGKDPILKERLFGLTNSEGNHGEDVKEYYFYLDSTPTHSYMKYLYKYPQAAYPYADLVETNRRRSRQEFEYELLDTGVFDQDRYFDVFVEYAKASPEDILIEITVCNRGPDPATLHLLPTLWFRNTWSWGQAQAPRPALRQSGPATVTASHPGLGDRFLSCDGAAALLFTENETNTERLFGVAQPHALRQGWDRQLHRPRPPRSGESRSDGDEGGGPLSAHRGGRRAADHPPAAPRRGILASPVRQRLRRRGREVRRRRRPTSSTPRSSPASLDADAANVMRQALAGMLWSKQFYYYDVDRWLGERGSDPVQGQPQARPPQRALASRLQRRRHLDAGQVGVSLVCGMGSRLPCLAADAGG